jgi:hypothetical protein
LPRRVAAHPCHTHNTYQKENDDEHTGEQERGKINRVASEGGSRQQVAITYRVTMKG